ncbi:uncharacterized protein [Penaeus vannamei]|uniref:uncharacterized protein n=1 Tax=Penaeus vannamei TaxID=6689 RepID=UPI00387F9CE1
MSFIPATPLDSAPLPPRFHRHRDPPAVRPRVSSGRLSSTETIFRSLREKKILWGSSEKSLSNLGCNHGDGNHCFRSWSSAASAINIARPSHLRMWIKGDEKGKEKSPSKIS